MGDPARVVLSNAVIDEILDYKLVDQCVSLLFIASVYLNSVTDQRT